MVGKPRSGKRKQWKRRSTRPRRTVNVNRSLQPVSQRYICRMKYAQTITTSNVNGQYSFNLNSLFSPDRLASANAHQPYGFDQLALLYNRYRVISCSYTITAPNTQAPLQIGALPCNGLLATLNTFDEIKENPRARWMTQLPTGMLRVLKGTVSIPSLFGRNKVQYMGDDRYQAEVNNSPSEIAQLQLFTGTAGGDYATAQILNVTLSFVCEFFDVKQLDQS